MARITQKTLTAKDLSLTIDTSGKGSAALGTIMGDGLVVIGMFGYLAVTTEETVDKPEWDRARIATAVRDAGLSEKIIEQLSEPPVATILGASLDKGGLRVDFTRSGDDKIPAEGIPCTVEGDITLLLLDMSE
jgi:hypothetical protein